MTGPFRGRNHNRVDSVASSGAGPAVGVNYGTILSGTAAHPADVALDPWLIPIELGLADDTGPLGGFTGRGWLIDRIDGLVARVATGRLGGYVVVEAEAGLGKSALAAYLAFSTDHGWPAHFSRQSADPETARANLAAQVTFAHLPPDAEERMVPLPGNYLDPAWFARLLAATQRRRQARGEITPLVLLVDGLDEAPAPSAGEVAFGLPRVLPPGVVIVATTRPGHALPDGTRVERIDVTGQANLDDLREHVTARAHHDPVLASRLAERRISPEAFTRDLLTRAGGVWIYALSVVEQVRDGELRGDQLDGLPASLAGYYCQNLRRIREHAPEQWRRVGSPLLGSLAAVAEPLTAETLAIWSGDLDVTEVLDLLDGPLRPFLVHIRAGSDPTGLYRLRHQSLRDFLSGQESDHQDATIMQFSARCAMATRRAHEAILRHIIPSTADTEEVRWDEAGPYAVAHLAGHAAACGQLDRLVLDPGYLLWTPLASLPRIGAALQDAASRQAVSARQLAGDIDGLTADERSRLLHDWALKCGSDALADSCRRRLPSTALLPESSMWGGTTHIALPGRSGAVQALGLWRRPDGSSLLVTGGHDGVVRLWDPASLQPAGELHGHTSWLAGVATWPRPDGAVLLATADRSGEIRLWDPVTLDEVDRLTVAGGVFTLCAWPQPDGSCRLVTGDEEGLVRLWDPATGVTTELPGRVGPVYSLTIWPLPDGTALLVTRHGRKMLRVWVPETFECATEKAGDFSAIGIWPQPNASTTFLATAKNGGDVWLWNYALNPVGSLDTDGHTIEVLDTWPGPDGISLLATASFAHEICLWDLTSWQPVIKFHGHTDSIRVMVHWKRPHDSTLLVSAGDDDVVRVWDPAAAESSSQRTGHTNWITRMCVCPLPDGTTTLVTGGMEERALLWHYGAREPAGELAGPRRWLNAVTAWPQPDGATLLVTMEDTTILVWDPVTHQMVDELGDVEDYDWQNVTTWARPDGTVLLVVADVDGLRLWAPCTPAPIGTLDVGPVRAMTAWPLPDGTSVLVTALHGGELQLWDPVSLANTGWLDGGHPDVFSIGLWPQPDGPTLLVTGGYDGLLKLWDPRSLRAGGQRRGGSEPVHAVQPWPQPNGSVLLAAGAGNGRVLLWSLDTMSPVAELRGHSGSVSAMAAWPQPDGTVRLVTTGHDACILIWSAP